MLRLYTSVLCCAAICLPASVYAQAPEAPVIVTGESKERKVCKSEPVVGSRFAKKICHTQAEWLAIQQQNRVTTEEYQRSPCRSGAASVGGPIQC
jgi:hypothetical protein